MNDDSRSTSSDDSNPCGQEMVIMARRRFGAAVAAIATCAEGHLMSRRMVHTARKSWVKHVARVGPRVFRQMYRMDIGSFDELYHDIQTNIETEDVGRAIRSAGSEVCGEVRLGMTLRYHAGGKVSIRVGHSQQLRCVGCRILSVCLARCRRNKQKLLVKLDVAGVDRRMQLEVGFAKKSRRFCTRGAIAALDGCLIWQRNPGRCVENRNQYYCSRKEKFSILLLAMCDAQRKFIWFDMSCTPTTHDSLAWQSTAMSQRVRRGDLPYPFYILADSAFTCQRDLICPGTDDNNFEHSSLRINIECAFGALIRRWGILWRPLEMEFSRRSPIVGFCIRLHNFCIDRRIKVEIELHKMNGVLEVSPGMMQIAPVMDRQGVPIDNLHRQCRFETCRVGGRDSTLAQIGRRTELESTIREMGLIRPYRCRHLNADESR